MNLDAGIRRYRYFWKYVLLGLAVILGFWLTWYPLQIILVFIDFFKAGALGGAVPRETRWLELYRLDFCSQYGCGLRGYSKIVGDAEFRIKDLNTIEFEASAALSSPAIYHRCG